MTVLTCATILELGQNSLSIGPCADYNHSN